MFYFDCGSCLFLSCTREKDKDIVHRKEEGSSFNININCHPTPAAGSLETKQWRSSSPGEKVHFKVLILIGKGKQASHLKRGFQFGKIWKKTRKKGNETEQTQLEPARKRKQSEEGYQTSILQLNSTQNNNKTYEHKTIVEVHFFLPKRATISP